MLGFMSFTIAVTVSSGNATVTTSGDVPDGEFTINGHEDNSARTLGVTRRSADGRYAQQASSHHSKES